MSKQANRQDIARQISRVTGFTIKDVLEVLKVEDEVVSSLVEKGYEVKKHKLFKLTIETKKEKKAWDGLNKRYYTIPSKKVIKIKPLSQLQQAIDSLNASEEEKDIEG